MDKKQVYDNYFAHVRKIGALDDFESSSSDEPQGLALRSDSCSVESIAVVEEPKDGPVGGQDSGIQPLSWDDIYKTNNRFNFNWNPNQD